MKKLLLPLLLLLLPVTGWGATYYVSPSGSNTSPYDTWAKAANLPETAVSAGNSVEGPHTMYIAPKTGGYYSRLGLTNANWANGTIIGVAAHGSTVPAAKGQVIIGYDTNVPLYSDKANLTAKNISLTGTDASHDLLYIEAAGFTGDNLYLYDGGRRGIDCYGTGFTITNSLFAGFEGHALSFGGAASGTISYSIMKNSDNKHLAGSASSAVYQGSSGALVLDHMDITGSGGSTIVQAGSGSTTVQNSNVEAGYSQGSYAFRRTAGTATSSNNVYVGNFGNQALLNGTISTTDDVITDIPRYRGLSRSGFFCFNVDDWLSYDFALTVESALAARGKKGSFAVNGIHVADHLDDLNAMQARGTLDIINHGYSHSYLNLTGTAFSITKADKTINIDRTANTITVSDTVTVTGFKAKTLDAIRTELTTGGASVGTLATNLSGSTLGEVLADSSGAQASPYNAQLLIDSTGATGYFAVEMDDTQMQTITGYTSTILAPPGTVISADGITAAQTLGWAGIRGESTTTHTGYDLTSINIYRTLALGYSALVGSTVADTIRNTKWMGQAIAQQGLLVNFYTHGSESISVDHINAILDTLITYFPEVTITDTNTAIATIRSAPWSTVDNITYTRTWTDASDFRLKPSSPCINAGTDVSLTTDYAGRAIRGVPDIGAYEFQPVTGGFMMGLGVGF
jgi:hypothetical protein